MSIQRSNCNHNPFTISVCHTIQDDGIAGVRTFDFTFSNLAQFEITRLSDKSVNVYFDGLINFNIESFNGHLLRYCNEI